MLIKPTIDELDSRFDTRYEIAMLAAKRAKDIKRTSVVLTEEAESNPLSQAAKEMKEGLIKAKYKD